MNDKMKEGRLTDKEINSRILLYLKFNSPTHIDLLNGIFYNGFIKKLGAGFITFEDRMKGIIPIFINQIKKVELQR